MTLDPCFCLNPATLSPPTGAPDSPYYSWVVRRGPLVFLAGMSPYAQDKTLIGTSLGDQTRQCFRNMALAMEAASGSIADVCSITIYVQATELQRDVYPQVNPICQEVFGMAPPARAVVGGTALPRASELVMISATAVLAT